jgi:hypothetical protein
MWEIILSQFKDGWVPATWLSATITIRKEDDWSVVINWESMTEIGNWRYSYEFVNYDRKTLYLIDTDWGATLDDVYRYQSCVNELDSYPNKKDWKGWGGWTITNNIDTAKLAQDVWKVKKDILEKQSWTIWKHVTELDTDEVLDAIDNLDIPNNEKELKDIIDKSDTILKEQSEIKWSMEKQWENLVTTADDIKHSVVEAKNDIYTHQEKISEKIDWVSDWIQNIEKIDYERIEKKIENEKVGIMPILMEIDWLKRNIIDEIKMNNYLAVKEFVKNSIDGTLIYENSKQIEWIKREFEKSVIELKSNLDKLSEKEIDFSPILNQIIEVSKQMDEQTKDLSISDERIKLQMEEQYKKSMKYIIYLAKNMWTITKNDIDEIKKLLSNIHK